VNSIAHAAGFANNFFKNDLDRQNLAARTRQSETSLPCPDEKQTGMKMSVLI
jgi:hypothetical protein